MLLSVWPKLNSSWASARSGVRSAGPITGPRKWSTLTLSWKEKALLNQLPPEFEQRRALSVSRRLGVSVCLLEAIEAPRRVA